MSDETVLTKFLAHWQRLRADGMSARALIDFHAAHKYLLMAHSVPAYKAAGRMLADLSGSDLDAVADVYIAELTRAFATPATREGHVNALQHIAGYFRGRISTEERQRLRACIEEFGAGNLPLSEPVALINQFLHEHPDEYLARQVYLQP